jgi:mono/diheme cytochrome c family protein
VVEMKNQKIRTLFLGLIGVLVTLSFLGFKYRNENGSVRTINVKELPVSEALIMLGDDKMIHHLDGFDASKAKIGEDLILYGKTKIDGKYSKRISKYFVCIDCHNLGREFTNLSSESPEDRFKYAKENGLTFLPGSTFWGIYNRTTFYNDDYKKKYGTLVDNARDTLQNATQVCAKYCSAGRYLEDWELESIMHYYKEHELKIKDLDLSENTLKNIQKFSKLKVEEKRDLIELIKNSYRQAYSATFLETMPTEQRKYGTGGDPETGKLIYYKSCLHCHAGKRVTNLNLDDGVLTAKMFLRNMKNYSDKSLYQIIRHGTYSRTGRKQYMPLYTEEKMSDNQINDLVAYIKSIPSK